MRRALFLLAALLAACDRPPPDAPYVLRIGVMLPFSWEGPKTLSGGAMLGTDLVYESVLHPTGGGLASPFLRRWERTGGGRWRLEFKPGARFSDGRPVTAEDLARSLQVRGFRVERDGDALLVESTSGAGDLAGLLLVPVASGGGTDALGTGPFAVAERSERRLLLRRLERRPGGIDAVELVAHTTGREAFAQLLRGQLNAVSPLERAQAELLEGIPGVRVISGPAPNAIVAFLNPGRLSREERRALAESVAIAEVAARAGLGAHCQGVPPRRAIPEGRPLRIGHFAYMEDNLQAALALRRALGARGGEVIPVAFDAGQTTSSDLDVLVKPALVWPSAMLAITLESGARFNPFGYASAAFDAAVRKGDDRAAEAVLQDDVPMLVLCRRERLMAVDTRVRSATVSDWGVLDTLPEWEVGP